MANFYANYPISGAAAGNPSAGVNGNPIPLSSTLVAGENPSLNLQPLQTDAAGNLLISSAKSQNSNGSFVQSNIIGSSVVSFVPPANAVGFILEASTSNTVNLRWAIVTLPTTTTGMRAEPGRDTGFIPCAATINVISESTVAQEVEITWVKSS